MTDEQPSTREEAQTLIDAGFAPLPNRGKQPRDVGWRERKYTAADFHETDNIGVKLGLDSGSLIDVDLDDECVLPIAPRFLPLYEDTARFGRDSKPDSHILYICDPGTTENLRVTYKDPKTGKMIAEIRGEGTQTIFPPSRHPSGERIEWSGSGNLPQAVELDDLKTRMGWMAAAAFFIRHWHEWPTQHHELLLHFIGMLALGGVDRKRATDFLSLVTVISNDSAPHERQKIVDTTYDRVAAGENVTGRKKLAEIIGTKAARALSNWLGCDSTPDSALKFGMSDVGNANRLIARYGDVLRYCYDVGSWYYFNGQFWIKDDAGYVVELAKESARAIPDEGKGLSPNEHAQLMKWGAASLSAPRIKAAVELAKTDADIAKPSSEFDTNRYVLNVANGTLNLETGGLADHDPHDFHSKIVEIAFDRHARCPLWLAHLERVQPDPEMRAYLQRWVGYLLTDLNREKALLIVDGPTGSGKTVTVNVIRRLLGPYANVVDESAFGVSPNQNTKAHDLVPLVGRRLVVWPESGKRMTLNEARVKSITGGNSSVIRRHYQEHQTVDLTAKILIETNDPPKISATDDAIWERVKRIPFLVQFSKEERRLGYEENLFRELPGILSTWAVEGAQEYFRIGLAEPDVAKKAARALREHQSDVFGFVEDECVVDPSKSTPTADLYAAFTRYSEANGIRFPISRRSFTEQISKLPNVEIRLGTAGNRSIVGLALRPGARVFAVPTPFDRKNPGKTDVG